MNEVGDGGTPRGAARLVALVPLLLAAGVAALLLAALAAPASLPVVDWARLPPWPALAGPVAAAAIGIGLRRRESRFLVHLLVAFALASAWFEVAVRPLGDHGAWRHASTTDRLAASELLANLAYRLVQLAFGERALAFVAPTVGVAAVFAWFAFGERAFARPAQPEDRPRVRAWLAVAIALGGLGIVFHRDYVENPMLSLPFAWLGLAGLVGYARNSAGDRRQLAAAAVWLALATATHGLHATALVAGVCCVVARPGAGLARRAGDLGLFVGVAVGVALVVVGGVTLAGFEVHAGHAQGGGDGHLFVPWRADELHAFGIFDAAHARAAGHALLAGCPFALAALAALLARNACAAARESFARQPALAVAGLGALALLFLVHFDLGFPGDLDLAVGISSPLLAVCVQVLVAAPTRPVVVAFAALAAVHAAALAGGLLVATEPPHPLGARGFGYAEPDTLTVNGCARLCRPRPHERLVYRLLEPTAARPPIAYTVVLHRGIPQPAEGRTTLCVPLPGEPGFDPDRTQVLCDGTGRSGAPAMPPFAGSVLTPPMPLPPTEEPYVLQAFLRDADGLEWASNAVVVQIER